MIINTMNRLPFILVTLIILPFILGCQQEIEPEIFFNENEFSISSAGGEFSVPFTSNVPLTVSISEDWVTEIVSKSTSETYYFKLDFNPEYDSRSCNITFSHSESGYKQDVKLTQSQQDAIIAAKSQYSLDYKEQVFTLPLSTNVDISVTTSADWISLITTKGLVSKDIQFQISENNSKKTREAVIEIISGNLIQSIKIRQLITTYFPSTEEEFNESLSMTKSIENDIKKELGILSTQTHKDTSIILSTVKSFDNVFDAVFNKDLSALTIVQKDGIVIDYVLDPVYLSPLDTDSISLSTQRASNRKLNNSLNNNRGRALILAGVNDLATYGADFHSRL